MRIITHRNNHFIRTGCLTCGQSFKLGDLAHDAYAADGEHLGMVCDPCLDRRDDEMLAQLREEAEHHRQLADALEALSRDPIDREHTDGFIDIPTGTIEPVTDDDRAEAKARARWAVNALLNDVFRSEAREIRDDEIPF